MYVSGLPQSFYIYRDQVTGWKVPERGLSKTVACNPVAPFVGVYNGSTVVVIF